MTSVQQTCILIISSLLPSIQLKGMQGGGEGRKEKKKVLCINVTNVGLQKVLYYTSGTFFFFFFKLSSFPMEGFHCRGQSAIGVDQWEAYEL